MQTLHGSLARIALLAATLACGMLSCIIVEDRDATRSWYQECSYDEQCPSYADCWWIAVDYDYGTESGRMCTTDCYSDFDCPYDGICEDVADGPPLCFEPCFGDVECPRGFACVDVLHDGAGPMCLPW